MTEHQKRDMPISIMFSNPKGQITTFQKCKRCNLPFKDTGHSLECDNGHTPTRYYIYLYWEGDKWIRYNSNGEPIRSYADALKLLVEINDRLTKHIFDPYDYDKTKITSLQFDTAINKWWAKNACHYSPKSQKDYRLRIKLFIDHFKNIDVRYITAKDIRDFRESLEGRSNKTINNIMGMLRTFINNLYEWEEIKRIPNFPKPYKTNYIYRSWCNWGVFMDIIDAIPNEIAKEAMITMRRELLRVGETRGLRWEDFLFDENTLIVRNSFSDNVFRETTKTGDYKVKHLHSFVKEMLLRRKGLPKAYVFTYRGKPYSESYLRKQFDKARDEKGYPKDITLSGATRHSSATEGYNRTKDIHATQKAIGHKDIRTTLKYTHTDKTTTEEIIEPKGNIAKFKQKK